MGFKINILMQLLINALKIDYTLSKWFSKTTKRVIPGTAFLFLNKVAFLWISIFMTIMSILPVTLSTEVFVIIIVLGGAIIMYGLQKKVEQFIVNLNLPHKYSGYTKEKIRRYRMLGIFEFILCFLFIFIVIVIFY